MSNRVPREDQASQISKMQGSRLQNRCSVQVFCIVSIQLAANTIVNIEGWTGASLNETHAGLPAKPDPTSSSTTIKTYANHRMADDDTSASVNTLLSSPNKNSSFMQADREGASSILRPQLALQIYTNPSPQESAAKSSSVFPRTFGPTMLIVPVQHKLPEDFHLTSSTHQVRHPHQTSKSSQGKINQWRYLTYQGNNLLDAASVNGLSEYHSAGSGPLINTIITVPAPSEQQQTGNQHPAQSQLTSSQSGPLQEEESKTSVDDQSIAKLLESQLAGNLEFTMTLNGEEITFNPATNKVRITRARSKVDPIDSSEDEGQLSIKRSSGRGSKENGRIVSRALKTHVDSDLVGDQQSASDIDLTDSVNEEDEADVEYDRFSTNSGAKQEDRNGKPRVASSDNERDSDRDEKLTGSVQNRHWPMDVGEDTDDQDNRDVDDQGIIETSSENRLTRSKKNKDSSSQPDSGTGKKGSSKVTKTGGSKSSSSLPMARKAQGSRKRMVHKIRDQSSDEKSDEKDDLPSVMIKSDDVRRFEQLLENLRSISLNTQATKNRRWSDKSGGKQKQAVAVLDSDEDGKDDEPSVDTKLESRHSSKSNENSDTTDCDRKRQQQLQKAASEEDSNSSYDLDSSSNNMDQEPSNDADNDKDNQDADSQNGEQEEQTRNHPQKVAAPQSSSSSSSGDKQSEQRAGSSGRDKPKSVVLRKTMLQSYYNQDADQMASQRDNIRAPYNPSDATSAHEKNTNKLGHLVPFQRGAQEFSSMVRRPMSSDGYYQSQQHYSDLRPNGYLGAYNHQPADRDAVRASESQRVKTVILPKMLTIRKIKPLQEMIGKAIMKPTSAA